MKVRSHQHEYHDSPAYRFVFIPPLENSTLIPPTGLSLSEDVDTTPGFILTAYDLDLRVLRGCYDGVEVSQESRGNWSSLVSISHY